MAVHQYDKQVRVDANVEMVMALNALQAYIGYKREKDLDRPFGRAGMIIFAYGSTEDGPLNLAVYETQTAYIVRRG